MMPPMRDEDDDDAVRLPFATEPLTVAADGSIDAVARNTLGGREASFALRISGGLQPSRVGGAVNPLAHVQPAAVLLRSLGAPTARFVQAVEAAFGQPSPPARSRWRRLFERPPAATSDGGAGGEARFAALLVSRDGDAGSPRKLHLKLFCDGGELYLHLDLDAKRLTLVEKDAEFRPALLRALRGLVGV